VTTWVALLRGINVGKAKRVAMADLRLVIESLGYSNARTLLNSGNAVFDSKKVLRKTAAQELQDALLKKTGVSSRFTLRSADEWAQTVKSNALLKQATDPTRLFAAFLYDVDALDRLQPLVKQPWKPDVVSVGPRVAYIWCPNGLLESKAVEAVGKALGDGVTIRNWATVMKIQALLD
jgi:uncharacterized protein (DUF1697 family)